MAKIGLPAQEYLFCIKKIIYIVMYIFGKFFRSYAVFGVRLLKKLVYKVGRLKVRSFFGGYLLGGNNYRDYIQTRCTKIGMVSRFLTF
ncbi:hypothetical protein ACSAZL_09125 [Methanosarcina sp. T3]|uniref:hypothetical protein n=1 Tax=Methanosarcina sp. T3 TaxID=3439062 RepID=UPI003F828660